VVAFADVLSRPPARRFCVTPGPAQPPTSRASPEHTIANFRLTRRFNGRLLNRVLDGGPTRLPYVIIGLKSTVEPKKPIQALLTAPLTHILDTCHPKQIAVCENAAAPRPVGESLPIGRAALAGMNGSHRLQGLVPVDLALLRDCLSSSDECSSTAPAWAKPS
jgi:hypothetical protein